MKPWIKGVSAILILILMIVLAQKYYHPGANQQIILPEQHLEPWMEEAIAQQQTQKLFESQCTLCHCDPNRSRCEKGIVDFRSRAPEGNWIYSFMTNEKGLIASGDKFVMLLRKEYATDSLSGGYTHSFKQFSNQQIDQLFDYVDQSQSIR